MLTIIIPVYNNEKHLKPCLDSVLQQTYHDFELYLVDDGSQDGSGLICDYYAEKDNRIRVIHQDNSGVSKARNVAIEKCKGQYIMFLDSDDVLILNSLNYMMGAMTSGVDLVISGYLRRSVTGDDEVLLKNSDMQRLSGNIRRDYCLLHKFLTVPVAKIYRVELIKKYNIRFPETMVTAEDQMFNYAYIEQVSKYCLVNKVGYIYNIHPNTKSLSRVVTRQAYESELHNLRIKKRFLIKYQTVDCTRIMNSYIHSVLVRFLVIDDEVFSYSIFSQRFCELSEFLLDGKMKGSLKSRIVCFCMQHSIPQIVFLYYYIKNIIRVDLR